VEHDAGDVDAVERLALVQDLADMPGNRLALSIRVRRQQQAVRALQRLGDRRQVLFRFFVDLPGQAIRRRRRPSLLELLR
jgi:hypothetical protein